MFVRTAIVTLVLELCTLGRPAAATALESDHRAASSFSQWALLHQELFQTTMDDTSPENVEAHLTKMLELERSIPSEALAAQYTNFRITRDEWFSRAVDPAQVTKFLLDTRSFEARDCDRGLIHADETVTVLWLSVNLRQFLYHNLGKMHRRCWPQLIAQMAHEQQQLEAADPQIGRIFAKIDGISGPAINPSMATIIESWCACVAVSMFTESDPIVDEQARGMNRTMFAREFDRLVRAPCRKVYGRTGYLLHLVARIMLQEGHLRDFMSERDLKRLNRARFCEEIIANGRSLGLAFKYLMWSS